MHPKKSVILKQNCVPRPLKRYRISNPLHQNGTLSSGRKYMLGSLTVALVVVVIVILNYYKLIFFLYAATSKTYL